MLIDVWYWGRIIVKYTFSQQKHTLKARYATSFSSLGPQVWDALERMLVKRILRQQLQ